MNPSLRSSVTAMALAVVALTSPGRLSAQAPAGCGYDECALRIKQTLFGQSLVRGLGDDKVAGLGLFAGSLEEVFAGNPSALDLAGSYRSRHNAGAAVALIGLVVGTVGLVQLSSDPWGYDSSAEGLVLGGTVVTLVGALISASGQDYLNRAVWEYNRGFAR